MRQTIQINCTDVAHIFVTGPTGIGKSVLMARIERMLKEEFQAHVVSLDLEQERRLSNPDKPAPHDLKSIKETIWVLREV